MKQRLTISPEPGLAWFLWGDPPLSKPEHVGLVATESVGFSSDLLDRFEIWMDQWRNNYINRDLVNGRWVPVWKDGFDSQEWFKGGIELMDLAQAELPELEFRNGFECYVNLS